MRDPIANPSPLVAKINVTPIIDVALVLVIILLVTAPILAVADLDVTLPVARSRGAEDELRITVTLGKFGEIAVDEDVVPLFALASRIQSKIESANSDDVLVVVRADEGIPHASVRRVIKAAKRAGAGRLAIATQQHGKDEA